MMSSSRIRTVVLPLAAVIAMLCSAFAAAYAEVPKAWNSGDTLKAADLNENFSALDERIAALESQLAASNIPAGTIAAYGGPIDWNPGEMTKAPENPPPEGWLLCNGMPLNGLDAKYVALYAAIKTSFGGTASSKSFNLPDLRGQFLRGVNGGKGKDPDAAGRIAMIAGGNVGDLVGSIQLGAVASHLHAITDPGHAHQYVAVGDGCAGSIAAARQYTSSCAYGYNTMDTNELPCVLD